MAPRSAISWRKDAPGLDDVGIQRTANMLVDGEGAEVAAGNANDRDTTRQGRDSKNFSRVGIPGTVYRGALHPGNCSSSNRIMFKYRLSTGLSLIEKVRRAGLDLAARILDSAPRADRNWSQTLACAAPTCLADPSFVGCDKAALGEMLTAQISARRSVS